MVFFSLSGWPKTSGRKPVVSRRDRRRGQRLSKRCLALRLEALEPRTVLSTLTVMNNLDHGAGSLRDTIAAANSGDRIVFAPSIHNITLTSGELDLTKSLIIDGPGSGKLTISGKNASRVFDVSPGATVTIEDLTIARGKAATGAGVDNSGKLTLLNCTVTDNQSVNGLGGGGILNEVGANLVLVQDVLSNNQAITSVMSDVLGGGLLNEGTAVVTSSTFLNNQALGGHSFSAIGGSAGGGLDNFGGATLTLIGSTFMCNQALAAGGGPYFGIGGALENNAGLDGSSPSTATISNCTFTGNLAGGGAGSTANGGAITNEGGATMTITGATVENNQAVGGNGGDGETTTSQGLGGGILNSGGATLTVTASTIKNNLALGGNNSTPTADNPLTGAGEGGGIENIAFATATVINSTIDNNEARGGTTALGAGGSATGGGIDCSFDCTMTLIDCGINGNLADAGHGTSGASAVPAGLAAGGGVQIERFSTVTITGGTIDNNTAIGGTGGTGANGGNAYGGGLEIGLNVILGYTDDSTVQITACAIDQNQAIGGTGGAGAKGGDGLGGGIAVIASSSATVSASAIEYNSALGGKGKKGGSNGLGIGGGVNSHGSFIFDAATVIKHNQASTSNDNIFP